MPVSSTYPSLNIPETDLYSFLFNRNDRPYSDDTGKLPSPYSWPVPHYFYSKIQSVAALDECSCNTTPDPTMHFESIDDVQDQQLTIRSNLYRLK